MLFLLILSSVNIAYEFCCNAKMFSWLALTMRNLFDGQANFFAADFLLLIKINELFYSMFIHKRCEEYFFQKLISSTEIHLPSQFYQKTHSIAIKFPAVYEIPHTCLNKFHVFHSRFDFSESICDMLALLSCKRIRVLGVQLCKQNKNRFNRFVNASRHCIAIQLCK